MYDFLSYALLAGVGVTFASAPLGALMIWRKMAYFGDTLAHAALLGLVLNYLLQLGHPLFGVAAVSIVIALLLLYGEHKTSLTSDSLLGVLSHVSLALGVVLLSITPMFRSAMFGFLFGDILSVNREDLVLIYSTVSLIVGVLWWSWRDLIAMTIHEDLAAVEGVNIRRQRVLLVLMLALLIAVAMKVLGVLLITAMLIVPAAAARVFAKTPESMVCIAWVISILSVLGGLWVSWVGDVPAGPAIVVMAGVTFVLGQGWAGFEKWHDG